MRNLIILQKLDRSMPGTEYSSLEKPRNKSQKVVDTTNGVLILRQLKKKHRQDQILSYIQI